MKKEYDENANRFKAFCDPNRLMILDVLKSGEHCACKLLELLDVSQSTLSHHMKILTDANMVYVRKAGKWSYYSLSEQGLQDAIYYLQMLSEVKIEVDCK